MLQRIGQVAYKLELPKDRRIHHVVHVSQLIKYIPSLATVSQEPPTMPASPPDQVTPVALLDLRLVSQGTSSVSQLLVGFTCFTRCLGGDQ